MKITIESTDQTCHVNGVPARIWEGTTESGIPVHCFVTRIAAPIAGYDLTQFERELQAVKPLSAELKGVYPSRMVLWRTVL